MRKAAAGSHPDAAASGPQDAAAFGGGEGNPPATPQLFALQPSGSAAVPAWSPNAESAFPPGQLQLPLQSSSSFGDAASAAASTDSCSKGAKSPASAGGMLKKLGQSIKKPITPKSSKHSRSDAADHAPGGVSPVPAGQSPFASQRSAASMDVTPAGPDQTPRTPTFSASQEAHTAEEDQDWASRCAAL